MSLGGSLPISQRLSQNQGKSHVESGLWIKVQGLACGEQACLLTTTPQSPRLYPCSITPLENYSRLFVVLRGGESWGTDGSEQATGSWPSVLGCGGNIYSGYPGRSPSSLSCPPFNAHKALGCLTDTGKPTALSSPFPYCGHTLHPYSAGCVCMCENETVWQAPRSSLLTLTSPLAW